MNLAKQYIDTYNAHTQAEEDLHAYAVALMGADPDDYNTWPFDNVWVDQADWEGTSLELKMARSGLTATREQCNRAHEEHGFDVIDIQYGDNSRDYKRFYPDATKDRWQRSAYIWGTRLDVFIGDDSEGIAA